ncbi:hypothetical protein SAMN05421640_3203 [Ekhidna lutea]|uniref:Helix-turn-helix domain-containing protein n=1 Tax=Ekhidna lutea TaxID=447679 RepID=A0A239LE91_EKHLU|nr:hypothetical protein [Ekhidna lutea]SNT28801.1 hypothetical protein SAMN05421640_3203 [Ekhidna lutea]
MRDTERKLEYMPLQAVLEELQISKEWAYKLARKGRLKMYYMDVNKKGEPSGKVFLRVDQINQIFLEKQTDDVL